jgi:hypothetical protein
MTTISINLSKPLRVNLGVYRGDSGNFRIRAYSLDTVTLIETPIDISAAVWDADIRTSADDPSVVTNFDIEPVVDDISMIDVILTAEHSALLVPSCVYDIQMILNGKTITLAAGNIKLTNDVSRSP